MTAVATVVTLWTSVARATITQGDFAIWGYVETREEGRWGEGSSSTNASPTRLLSIGSSTFASPGKSFGNTGGSFDFNHWDLVEARQLADVRPDYHMIKNYKLLGRFDTLLIKDADFFGYYRPWYDAYGTLKNHGRQKPNEDAEQYDMKDSNKLAGSLQNEYFKDDFREYYAQLNFTDNFSMRIGKQQVIWAETDALSGTEVTNPVNVAWHGVYGAESPEDIRTNLRMIKLNYILPDFFKTANNEFEGFIIPGDWEPTRSDTDPRNPWVVPVPFGSQNEPFALSINQSGQQLGVNELPNVDDKAMIFLPIGPCVGRVAHGAAAGQCRGHQYGEFYDVLLGSQKLTSRYPSNSLQNSEFGLRLSSLLPIGNGLQASFIYLYEFRDARANTCYACTGLVTGEPGAFPIAPGLMIIPNFFPFGHPRAGVPVGGTVETVGTVDYRRNQFFGMTGTYYDKDVTDVVYRYDLLYQPDHAVAAPLQPTGSAWTEMTRWIIAGDRPTYIPWLSKQHTFLTAQYTMTWLPDRPTDAQTIVIPGLPGVGKTREMSNLFFLSAVDWLVNGQLTTGNVVLWDMDDQTFELSSGNSYRYSRNIVLGLNVSWFMGRSGRYTDPYLLSRSQRFNDAEFTFTYEI